MRRGGGGHPRTIVYTPSECDLVCSGKCSADAQRRNIPPIMRVVSQYPALAAIICSQWCAAAIPSPLASTFTTLVGTPEVVAGPTCCLFDSPFLALATSAGTLGYTANSASVVLTRGPSVSALLPTPLPTGLAADKSPASLSHCGKWLNAAFTDPGNASVVHGFFHQEWQCNYTDAGFTNKSVGYAASSDGGITFVPSPAQLIAGYNTTASHQTGEGDHGVFRRNDHLYMLFVQWDAPKSVHGGTSIGLARSHVSSAGAPGTWRKYFAGDFLEPGVGGKSDLIWAPGTAASAFPAGGPLAAVAVGVIFSSSLAISWSQGDAAVLDGAPLAWEPAAAGPLFFAGSSSWDRNPQSKELFGYPSLVTDAGSPNASLPASAASFIYFTYLNPGEDFTKRWLIRRPLRFLQRASPAPPDAPPPPALSSLTLWATAAPSCATGARWWAAGGPVAPHSAAACNFTSAPAPFAHVLTAPPADAAQGVELVECALGGGAVALARATECGSSGGPFAAGSALRCPGWALDTLAYAEGLGWGAVVPAGGGGALSAAPLPLWRCSGGGGGSSNFSAALGSCNESEGWEPSESLGFAFGQLRMTPPL